MGMLVVFKYFLMVRQSTWNSLANMDRFFPFLYSSWICLIKAHFFSYRSHRCLWYFVSGIEPLSGSMWSLELFETETALGKTDVRYSSNCLFSPRSKCQRSYTWTMVDDAWETAWRNGRKPSRLTSCTTGCFLSQETTVSTLRSGSNAIGLCVIKSQIIVP